MKKLILILLILLPFIGFSQVIRNTQITSAGQPDNRIMKSDGSTNVVWDDGSFLVDGIRDTITLHADTIRDHELRLEQLELIDHPAVTLTTDDSQILSLTGQDLTFNSSNLAKLNEPTNILNTIKTVDGSGSGLDADLWDGYHRPQGFAKTATAYEAIESGDWSRSAGASRFLKSSSSGLPEAQPSYWFQLGARDNYNGYAGILVPFDETMKGVYIGHGAGGSFNPTWVKIWTARNANLTSVNWSANVMNALSYQIASTPLLLTPLKSGSIGSAGTFLKSGGSTVTPEWASLSTNDLSDKSNIAFLDAATNTFTGDIFAPSFNLDASTSITKDASNNLTFTDAVTGTKTLAELAAGGATQTLDQVLSQGNSSTNKISLTGFTTYESMVPNLNGFAYNYWYNSSGSTRLRIGYDEGDDSSIIRFGLSNTTRSNLKIQNGNLDDVMTFDTNDDIFMPMLPNTTTANAVYYDQTTGKLSYGAAGGGGSSPWVSDANGINYQAGNVGVGANSDSFSKLYVNQPSSGKIGLKVSGSDSSDGIHVNTGNASTKSLLYLENYNSTVTALDVRATGDIYAYALPSATSTDVLYYDPATGKITHGAAGGGGGAGTVTSVGFSSSDLNVSGSPITTSGTITANLASGSVDAVNLANNVISGQTAISSTLLPTDELMVSDGGLLRRMDISILQTYMQNNLSFGGGGISDGNKGDITVSGGGTVWDINAGVVGSLEIASSGVGTSEIATGAVTGSKLNTNVISSQTEMTDRPQSADEVLISDAGAIKRASMATLEDYNYRGGVYFGTSVTVNYSTGKMASITLTGNTTITITNLPDRHEGQIDINNPSGYTLNINGSTGYTTEVVMGAQSAIKSSGYTTIFYWRDGNLLKYGFLHEN